MAKYRAVTSLSLVIIGLFLVSSISTAVTSGTTANSVEIQNSSFQPDNIAIGPDEYNQLDDVLNIEEQMTLSPIFTPDNALDVHVAWLKKANSTIDVQIPYIRQFDRDKEWQNDPNPIVSELVNAAGRGVQVRVQINELADSDDVTSYLNGITNIEVRYMGLGSFSEDGSWLTTTHNKLVIIDSKVTLVSSINFSQTGFLYNREAGMVVQNTQVTGYYLNFFNADWDDGEEPMISQPLSPDNTNSGDTFLTTNQGASFTDIPRSNFSGVYNVSAYVNPDNADEHIFKYLESAQESIYVSMYKIERQDFVDTLVELKNNNPSLDIQVLLSNKRTAGDGDPETQAAALELTENLIPVYNSSEDLEYYHNKYWIIDQKHTFIYSGNWSPRSVTPKENDNLYSSSFPNRDMGIAVHDATDIANFVKSEVWDKDVEVAAAYDLPVGISQNSFERAQVVSGTVTLAATVNKLTDPTVSYSFSDTTVDDVTLTDDSFEVDFDTTTIDNGITTFRVEAINASGASFADEVTVNVVNIPENDNFRFLITEVLPNPEVVADTEGEFFELTNSFPFPLLIDGWKTGAEGGDPYTFPAGYEIAAYSSIIIARDLHGFWNGYGINADFELEFSLANTGDYIMLLDQSGDYVDVVAYGIDAPDGSETISADFDEGLSISRDPLHRDTDKVTDFTFADPSPGGVVPRVPLGEGGQEDLPMNFVFMAMVLLIVPIVRRRR